MTRFIISGIHFWKICFSAEFKGKGYILPRWKMFFWFCSTS